MSIVRKTWTSLLLVAGLGAALYSLPGDIQNAPVSITVDAGSGRRPINPNIYGTSLATATELADLNIPLNRYGGNNASRYNWQLNADNRAHDWFFESIAEPSTTPGARADAFIATARAAGAEPMITIPTIGWIARLGPNRGKLASFSQAKYGPQTANDWQWFPDAGNGILQSTGRPVESNDPNDANVPNSAAFQQQWVQAIVGRWGPAASGGLQYYVLDNEPSLWHATHRDVQPAGLRMEEAVANVIEYAAAIKAVDPDARIVGPEEWGWSGYIVSGYDQQYGNTYGWSYLPDRASHGGWEYLPWMLNQLKLDGRRLLDLFTVHYYPQGGEFSSTVTSAMQLRRNRSTRSLWDPTYVDESWINDEVMLIPRLRNWVDTYYVPGTPIGVTEYNWGAEAHINGATTQADILGIFGREGLDMAARWRTPAASSPTYKAFQMYRNYDGNRSTFGDVSVSTTGGNPDELSVFAAERTSDGTLTIMIVAKVLSGSTPVNLAVNNFTAADTAMVYELTAANTITRLSDLPLAGSEVSLTVPAQSITLLVVPGQTTGNQRPVAVASGTPDSGIVPLTVAFSSVGSNDPDGWLASYLWAFGDGTTSTEASPTHTYQTAGTYTATFTVTDNSGATGMSTVTITATADPGFIAAPTRLSVKGSRRRATLSWRDNSDNESGFHVERAAEGSSSFSRVASLGADAQNWQDRVPRGTYRYRVQAFNASATSGYTETVTVTVR